MSDRSTRARRAELLAEVFFQELKPKFVTRPPTPDVGYDLLVGFPNDKSGINTYAVEVKSTEEAVGPRFPIERKAFNRIVHSNVPGMLLVVDVKHNRLYYAWLRPNGEARGTATVSIPMIEVTEATKAELRRQLRSADNAVAAAG
jgi:hypothetical protein